MKAIAINGSPHKGGNTARLIAEVARGLAEAGHECQVTHLRDLRLGYCDWCEHCATAEPGVCPQGDGFHEHLADLNAADLWIVATPSSNHSVTGYTKNWLDRLCTSQLSFEVDAERRVTMRPRIRGGKRAVMIVQGCTDRFAETLEPLQVVLSCLAVPIVERLIVAKVGLTADDTVDRRPDVLRQAYEIGLRVGRAGGEGRTG